MAASQDYMDKALLRRSYRNVWHTDLTNAIQADFPYCCLSLWCGPCVSYMLRRRALYNDMSRYVCCAGYMPCSGRCGESKCPELCLATEAFLCFGSSVASTRFLLQDEFNIQTTQCDNCIILHVLPPAAGLHLLPGRLHRRQPGALRGFAGDLLRLRRGLLDGLLLYADAAQGGDGQEGRQAGRSCDDGASDAADVAHRSADAASGRVCAAAAVPQVVLLWDLGLPLRVSNGWRSSS